MDIGKRIRILRSQRGMEQLELAEKVEISQSKMNKIETGFQKRIEPEILSDIAKVLGVKIDFIVNGEENEESERKAIMNKIATEFPDIDLMFNDIKSWTAEEFEELYDYIKFKESQKEKK